jgi:hypothetical protein
MVITGRTGFLTASLSVQVPGIAATAIAAATTPADTHTAMRHVDMWDVVMKAADTSVAATQVVDTWAAVMRATGTAEAAEALAAAVVVDTAAAVGVTAEAAIAKRLC